jgi:hypothetical protein
MAGKLSSKIKSAFPSLEYISFKLLIEVYDLSLDLKEYSLDWEEEQFSQYLVDIMKRSPLRVKYQLTIGVERKLNDGTKLPLGNNHPKKLPRIDINIISWSFVKNVEQEYFFEAKNLCENTWNKSCGSVVNASKYQKRYITTGIENFRIARYYNGAIIGYVLQGNIVNIITKLNSRLLTDTNTIQEISNLVFIFDYNDIYNSKHITPFGKEIEIKHLFLKF